MAKPNSPVEVLIADAATAEVVEAFGRLLPQLSSSAARLTRESLAEIIGAPHNTVLLARDPSAGNRIIGTLTLVIFRIPRVSVPMMRLPALGSRARSTVLCG